MTNASTQTARGFGALPSEWRLVKLKHLATKIGSGKTPRGGNEVYAESGVLFLRSQNVYDDGLRLDDVVFIDEDTDAEMAQTRVRPQDVLLNITGASIGRTAIVPDDLPSANVNQHVCIIRLGAKTQPRFVSYALKSQLVKDQIRSYENGSSREGLNFEQVGNLLVALPGDQRRQRQAADHLDRKTAQIDALIAKKQQQIGLLETRRAALALEAVTGKLSTSVSRKPSGLKWVGDIPEGWSVIRLKVVLAGPIEQGWSPQCESRQAEDGEWGVLKVGCVNGHHFDASEQKALPAEVEPEVRWEIRQGDILISRGNTRELVGSAALVREVRPRLLLCDLLYRFRVNGAKADPEFIVMALRSRLVRHQLECEATGTSSSMKKVGQETIKELAVCLPPLAEQQRLVEQVRRETMRIDQAQDRISQQSDHLREYRQAVITAAVTGQVEPRPREES